MSMTYKSSSRGLGCLVVLVVKLNASLYILSSLRLLVRNLRVACAFDSGFLHQSKLAGKKKSVELKVTRKHKISINEYTCNSFKMRTLILSKLSLI